jgi:pyruvate formate lyase activating enzyme
MKFSGLQKTSLIDFPDQIASVLFTPGCNLRCPFCQNWKIVLEPKDPYLSGEAALKILESRTKFIEAVVLTGGEPTIHEDLPRFIKQLKLRGFAIKMDTNGFFPHVLEKCLPYLSYVAMDVKTCLERYGLLGARDMSNYLRTIDMLKRGSVEYEFRSTVVPGFVEEEYIPKMGELVKGAKRFVFQQFVPEDNLDKRFHTVKPYSPETIAHFADMMNDYVDEIILRI